MMKQQEDGNENDGRVNKNEEAGSENQEQLRNRQVDHVRPSEKDLGRKYSACLSRRHQQGFLSRQKRNYDAVRRIVSK
jgi:hypothetical protein